MLAPAPVSSLLLMPLGLAVIFPLSSDGYIRIVVSASFHVLACKTWLISTLEFLELYLSLPVPGSKENSIESIIA